MSRPRTRTEEQKKRQHQKYNAVYDKENTTRLAIKLNTNTDRDILDFLTTIPNKQGYIKDLVRSDMAARKLVSDISDLSYTDPETRKLVSDISDLPYTDAGTDLVTEK